jgi:hypothetical protein
VLEHRVRPVRERLKATGADAPHRKYWWRFANTRRDLRAACAARSYCLATARVSKHLMISRVPSSYVFSEQVVLFGSDSCAWFSVLQSRLHELWVRRFATRLGEGLRYSASECFETFPFPPSASVSRTSSLEQVGRQLLDARTKYMLSENVGLTTTYNRLKNADVSEPAIVALRRLHEEVDRAALEAYGWTQVLAPTYDCERSEAEVFEDDILQRLVALNAERAAESTMPSLKASPDRARAFRTRKGAR